MLHLVCMDPLSVISLTKTQMRMPYRNKKCVQMLHLLKINCKHVVVENEHCYTITHSDYVLRYAMKPTTYGTKTNDVIGNQHTIFILNWTLIQTHIVG